jgi:hypothetical protein
MACAAEPPPATCAAPSCANAVEDANVLIAMVASASFFLDMIIVSF